MHSVKKSIKISREKHPCVFAIWASCMKFREISRAESHVHHAVVIGSKVLAATLSRVIVCWDAKCKWLPAGSCTPLGVACCSSEGWLSSTPHIPHSVGQGFWSYVPRKRVCSRHFDPNMTVLFHCKADTLLKCQDPLKDF